MNIKQVYELVNTATRETLGESVIVNEDLSNVVDIGDAVFRADGVETFAKSLINHIGRVIFVNRVYKGSAPSVIMDAWAYGSVCEKISSKMPTATENEAWMLKDGTSYDPNIFHAPEAVTKFFNKYVTFEIDRSIPEYQLKQSFQSAEQMGAFVSLIFNEIDKSLTVKVDALVLRTISNFIASTLKAEYPSNDYTAKSTVKAVNLLYLYNETHPDSPLTKQNAMTSPDFIRFASVTMKNYAKRLATMSTLFNMGAQERFTPDDMLKVILLAEFEANAEVYLYDGVGQFGDRYIKIPDAETVTYWQGSGTDYSFENTSAINVKTADGDTVEVNGILGVMFDRDALGICNVERSVKTHINNKGDFVNYFYKHTAGYFNDFNENFVVFFIA